MAIIIHQDIRSEYIINSMEYQLLLSKYEQLKKKYDAFVLEPLDTTSQYKLVTVKMWVENKEKCDATQQKQIQSSSLPEYQNGDQSGQTAEAGSSNRAVSGVSQSEAQAGYATFVANTFCEATFPAIPTPAPKGIIE